MTLMNYGSTTYIYGTSKLALKYRDDKLNELIGEYINKNQEFSFSQLCNYVLSEADKHNMLDKEPNTSYSQILLTHHDVVRICKILWERIWSKEVMILFNTPQDYIHRNEETYFIVSK